MTGTCVRLRFDRGVKRSQGVTEASVLVYWTRSEAEGYDDKEGYRSTVKVEAFIVDQRRSGNVQWPRDRLAQPEPPVSGSFALVLVSLSPINRWITDRRRSASATTACKSQKFPNSHTIMHRDLEHEVGAKGSIRQKPCSFLSQAVSSSLLASSLVNGAWQSFPMDDDPTPLYLRRPLPLIHMFQIPIRR
jgi:hypothetical protein